MARKMAFGLFVCLLALALAACGEAAPQAASGALTCTVQVSCANAIAYEGLDAAVLELQPADGQLLDVELSCNDGETAYDAFIRALQEAKLSFETDPQLSETDTYFDGVNNLYTGDCGDLSGWMYSVNGEFPEYACGQYVLTDGDLIQLQYTCDMGADLGYTFE